MHSHFRSNRMKCFGRVRGKEEEEQEEEEELQKVAERYTQRLRSQLVN